MRKIPFEWRFKLSAANFSISHSFIQAARAGGKPPKPLPLVADGGRSVGGNICWMLGFNEGGAMRALPPPVIMTLDREVVVVVVVDALISSLA